MGPSNGVWTAVDVPLGGGATPRRAGDPGIGIDPLTTSGDGGGGGSSTGGTPPPPTPLAPEPPADIPGEVGPIPD